MKRVDVIIVGGGLAGLTAAIHLAKNAVDVLVFEKQKYPHHKVCGEYVSNEIAPYLESLGVSLANHGAVPISKMQLSTVEGKVIETELPLGGIGISRYAFDHILYQKAISLGVSFCFESVTAIVFDKNQFKVTSKNKELQANFVIGAYGKRSNLDKHMNRGFIQEKSSWLGVKAHYELDDFPDDLVALHNFKGGYGGLSKTESGAVNFCYLASYDSFKREKDIVGFNKNVVAKNPYLAAFLRNAKPLFEQPLSIAQISFHPKKAVENHVLMCGDTAGLIHPLCGNGMAMAIHSAKIASELIYDYLHAGNKNRGGLEMLYEKQWNAAFKNRLSMGRRLQALLLNDTLSNLGMRIVSKSPSLLNRMIKHTHGEPIVC